MSIVSINPATGETIQTYEAMSTAAVTAILAEATQAFHAWRQTDLATRATAMRAAAAVLRARRDTLADLMTAEMGKRLADGRGEVDKCAWVCEYYAEQAATFLAPEPIASDASKSFVTFQPLGVVLAVMPWNFPLWQVFRFAAPGLMAGNAAVLKHASNVPGCALAIEDVFRTAGFPPALFRTLLIGHQSVPAVIAHEAIQAVTLTGSTPAGRAVAAEAGAQLKKTVLELGGSDPYIILADADFDAAVSSCVESRLINAGQSCIAAKRFIIPAAHAAEIEERFVAQMKSKKLGDPTDAATDVGPQARRDLRDGLHQQVQKSIDAGARCLCGGKVPDGSGAYYPPTVLSGVRKGMPAYDEELFGPVAALITVEDEAEAIRVANDTTFGLGAAIFTADTARGEAIAADQLQAGCCFVNAFVKSDPRLPFGGIKASGYGRELGSFGIREFVNVKTVYVK